MTTVILPAGGIGSRFDAPYAKELHVLRPGISIIDTTMTACAAMGITDLKFVVVAAPAKLDLICHLARYNTLDIAIVHQRPRGGSGLGSALRSAEPFCDEAVLLCLPDQVYLDDPAPALSAALRRTADVPMAVVATVCTDPERLRRDGALLIEHDTVHRAAEKPTCPDSFNACWSSLAFKTALLPTLADELDNATSIQSMVGSPVVWGPGFVNVNSPDDATMVATAGGWP